MKTKKVKNTESITESVDLFIESIGEWVKEGINDLEDELPIDIHDQMSFTLPWRPYMITRDDEKSLEFMKKKRDEIFEFFTKEGRWKHGYWQINDCHHGSEHFEFFIENLWQLDPGDENTLNKMEDAVEHIGNWVEEIPDWFNRHKNLFYCYHFGTGKLKYEQGDKIENRPQHMRCVNLCLFAYNMIGKEKYLDFAVNYGTLWAEMMINSNGIPNIFTEDQLEVMDNGEYRLNIESDSTEDDLVDRVENNLANGVINSFLELFKLTGEKKFKKAAEELLDVVSRYIDDYEAGCGADVIRRYRNITGDNRYDQAILDVVDNLNPYDFTEVSIKTEVNRERDGIGIRGDKPGWYEDGKPAQNNPITLAVAAEIKSDEKLAIRAVDIARTYFELAKKVFPHGHTHGCSSTSIGSIGRGSGRENNSGVITAVLEPVLARFSEYDYPEPGIDLFR
ncbi:MAG: hypothetical protein ACOC1S_04905 [bacterium]